MLELLIELSDDFSKDLDFNHLLKHYEKNFFKDENEKE